MADEPTIIQVEFPDEPRKPPYPHGGLNGLTYTAFDTGDAADDVELLKANLAAQPERGREFIAAIPYAFNGGAQPGYIVVFYDKNLDPFYDDDPSVHPPPQAR